MRMIPSIAFAALAFLATAGVASAASSVYGPGPAEECYRAALNGESNLEAVRICDIALSSFDLDLTDRAATLVNRGVIRLKRREPAQALADFDRAIAWRPTLGEAHVNRGAALILSGDLQGAVASIDRGLELGAEDAHEAYFNRGIAHERLDNLPAAYRDYRRAAELKPDWPLPQAELARFTVVSR